MSRRNSVGDLVPRDITEVLAREAKTNKAKRKNGGSLSRALGWFRGDRKKKSDGGGRPEPRGRAADSQTDEHSLTEPVCTKAASKPEDDHRLTVHYQVSPHYQENVFIEGSRPHYLQDLHIEAQEGLKKLQQDEKRSDLDFQDGQSVSSSAVLPPGGDSEHQDRKGSLESGSTAGDSVLMASRRSSLSRQGSTFKPLNPTKKVERSKKRGRRTTIMGIPQHVQKELGLERSTLFHENMDRQLTNGREAPPDVVVIPTVDGDAPAVNHEGARVHLLDLEVLQSSKEERLLKQHIQEVYRDDLALGRQFGHRLSPSLRPKSLAVPGLTTTGFLQEPQGPVMSISPQATYLSKIIPNAILPVEVDVIEISRCRSRSSVRTVSKSSVASGSPASSRSQVRHGPSSADSNWSHSQSSETIVSNSSTISSKGSASQTLVLNGREQSRQLAPDQLSVGSATSWVSSASAGTKPQVELNSYTMHERDEGESQRSDHSCVRSMSVMKTRMPPAPPTRTYSLHSKNIKPCLPEVTYSEVSVGKISRINGVKHNNILEEALSTNLTGSAGSPTNSADSSLDDSRSSVSSSIITPDQTVTLDSVLSSGESSPQKLAFQDNKFDRTLSPSSGYSSQSGTPTLSAKEICPPSPGKMKAKPAKPERIGSRASPVASISSSLTSLSSAMSEPVHQEAPTNGLPPQIPKASHSISVDSTKVSPTLGDRSLKEVFDIPPPPKVKAPCPPPPETWMHNRRTFDLLCGPRGAANRFAMLQKQQATVLLCDQGTAEGQQQDEDLTSKKKEVVMESQKEQASVPNSEFSVKSFGDPPAVKIEEGPVKQTAEHVQKQKLTEPAKDQSLDGEVLQLHQTKQKKEQEDTVIVKKMPPPVMKRSSLIAYKKENLKAEEYLLAQMKMVPPEVKINSSPEEILTTQKEDAKVKDPVVGLKSTVQTLLVEGIKQVGISPPPSPPPSHQPPPPPSKKSPPTAVPSVFQEHHQETPTIESSWPPPPPPPMENSTPIFEGHDELDFPPPPPPVFQETLLDGVENFPVAEIQRMSGATEERAIEEEPPEELAPSTHRGTTDEECRTQVVTHTGGDVTQESTGSSATFVNPITTEVQIHCSTTPLEMRPTSTVSQYSESQVPRLPPPLPEGIPPPPQEAPPLPPATVIQTDPPAFSHVPHASILLGEKQATKSFKRPSTTNRDGKGKDQLSRSKSTPVPKEDANIPLVTPSLLQMVRLRSVNVSDDQTTTPAESIIPTESNSSNQDQSQIQTCSHSVPQKPIRKSLSMKSPPPVGTSSSMRLQEAIRMKTAAMRPKEGVLARPSLQSSGSVESGALSPWSPEGGDIHKSPASTASFIFSRSTKKVIIETPTSPELQSSLKQSLAAELMQITDSSSSSVASNPCAQTQTKKPSKIPPPVARKPEYVPNQREKSTSQSANVENANGHTGGVRPAGQQAQQTDGD